MTESKKYGNLTPSIELAGCGPTTLHQQRGMPAGVNSVPFEALDCYRLTKGTSVTSLHTLPLLEIRSQAQGLITGYATVFGGLDSYGDTIHKGAFSSSIAQHQANGTTPSMLWAHRHESPIGRWTELLEDERGLRVSGQLNLKTEAGREAFEHLRAGDLNGLSIGYRVPAGGSEYQAGINHLKQIDLQEISVVALPADSAARISAVKSQITKPSTLRGLEEALESVGFSRREARNIAQKGFAGISNPDPSQEIAAILKAAASQFESI